MRLDHFEKRANEMVEKSGILQGITRDRIRQAGKHINLRKGCREFFRKIATRQYPRVDVHVISYSWSGELIKPAFPGIQYIMYNMAFGKNLYIHLL